MTQCSVGRNDYGIAIRQVCDRRKRIIFEDLTQNHNKAQIIVSQSNEIAGERPCPMTVIIQTRGNNTPIEREIEVSPFPANPDFFSGSINLQVEDVQSVAIRCVGNPSSMCTAEANINITFCICCC